MDKIFPKVGEIWRIKYRRQDRIEVFLVSEIDDDTTTLVFFKPSHANKKHIIQLDTFFDVISRESVKIEIISTQQL